MKITRENYELWFLDYLDGNLLPEMEAGFNDFLAKNPDLAAEIESISPVNFLPEEVEFKYKHQLKKSVYNDQETFDNSAIALLEGDLSGKEKTDFEKWLESHPKKKKEAGLFIETKLVADHNIIFPQKSSLKKKSLLIPMWTRIASIAAILVVAFLLFSKEKKQPLPDETADVNIEVKKSEIATPIEIVSVSPKENIKADSKIQTSQLKKTGSQSIEKIPIDENVNQILAKESRDPGIILAELPRKTVIFEIVDELQVVQKRNRVGNQMDREVELSELLKPQLAAIRKSEDLELFSSDHIALSGLQLVAKMSGSHLTAKRTGKGEIKSVSFNTRLLAFSIPMNR